MWKESLKRMKAESGLTTAEIAKQADIPEPTLEKLFAGVTKDPKLPTMKKLVHFLGYTLDDLYPEEKEKEKAPAPSEDSTRAISIEALEAMLIQGGFIRPDEDLSDDDLDFLLSVGRIVETWFRKRQKHGGE